MSNSAKRKWTWLAVAAVVGAGVWSGWPRWGGQPGVRVSGWSVESGKGGGGEVRRLAGVFGSGEAAGSPVAEYPAIATERLIRASLGLLAKNGADLSRPLPSRHRVLAASPAVVERVAAWAETAGYVAGEAVRFHEHGGVERFEVDLVRLSAADPRVIEAQGREVFDAVGRIPGAFYQTWMGDIVR